MTTEFTEGKRSGDFLLSYRDPQTNMHSAVVSTTALGGTQTAAQPEGLPVLLDKAAGTAVLLAVANFSTANGYIVSGPAFENIAQNTALDGKYTIVAGYGVAVNEDAMPATDAEGAAIDAAAKTALRGAAPLEGFTFRTESPSKSTQLN